MSDTGKKTAVRFSVVSITGNIRKMDKTTGLTEREIDFLSEYGSGCCVENKICYNFKPAFYKEKGYHISKERSPQTTICFEVKQEYKKSLDEVNKNHFEGQLIVDKTMDDDGYIVKLILGKKIDCATYKIIVTTIGSLIGSECFKNREAAEDIKSPVSDFHNMPSYLENGFINNKTSDQKKYGFWNKCLEIDLKTEYKLFRLCSSFDIRKNNPCQKTMFTLLLEGILSNGSETLYLEEYSREVVSIAKKTNKISSVFNKYVGSELKTKLEVFSEFRTLFKKEIAKQQPPLTIEQQKIQMEAGLLEVLEDDSTSILEITDEGLLFVNGLSDTIESVAKELLEEKKDSKQTVKSIKRWIFGYKREEFVNGFARLYSELLRKHIYTVYVRENEVDIGINTIQSMFNCIPTDLSILRRVVTDTITNGTSKNYIVGKRFNSYVLKDDISKALLEAKRRELLDSLSYEVSMDGNSFNPYRKYVVQILSAYGWDEKTATSKILEVSSISKNAEILAHIRYIMEKR